MKLEARLAPRPLFLIGMPGCGKSVLGERIAEALALPFADIDARIEAQIGMPIARFFAEQGEPAFRALERQTLETLAAQPGATVIATGGGIVLDPANVETMRARGTVLWIDRPLADIIGDVRQDTRPLLAGNAALRLQTLFAQREPLYRAAAHLRLDNSGCTREQAAQRALALL